MTLKYAQTVSSQVSQTGRSYMLKKQSKNYQEMEKRQNPNRATIIQIFRHQSSVVTTLNSSLSLTEKSIIYLRHVSTTKSMSTKAAMFAIVLFTRSLKVQKPVTAIFLMIPLPHMRKEMHNYQTRGLN